MFLNRWLTSLCTVDFDTLNTAAACRTVALFW